jgi:hypothetical protein
VKIWTKEEISDMVNVSMRNVPKSEIGQNLSVIKHLLSGKFSESVIKEHFETTIRRGHYFKFALAVKAVENSNFSREKRANMVAALKYIRDAGGVEQAREHIVKRGLNGVGFNDSLVCLAEIGVNPITIPDDRGIDFIPGLLEVV